jgi:multidrug efflux pump subunit AcrB
MKQFNLSEWAVHHRVIVVFLILLMLAAGVDAYNRLGRQEDPDFAVQTMVIQMQWPGATTLDTMLQVTDRLEKKLEETPNLDYTKSFTKPGVSTVYVYLRESTPEAEIPWVWYQVRKKVYDVQQTFPRDVLGPYYNDEFGDVFGIIYGMTYDGFTMREARDFTEEARAEFLRAGDVGKVQVFGEQEEKIYLSFSPQRLAALSLNFEQVLQAIAQQNAVTPSGVINTDVEKILVEVSGSLLTKDSIEQLTLYINNRFYQLSDIASVQRGYVDPPTKMFRVNGKPAIGIGVSMRSGGNNLEFGESLRLVAERLNQRFPIGMDLVLVSDQPQVVKKAIGGFTKALAEAIAIVLVVSFLSLGFRAGLVVALSIPLVLAVVFVGMEFLDISLQRISLGALIISLGLLVDDAMITVEMMISKMEEGMEKIKAATFAYTATAFPMLSGTLITIFGFMPIGFADNNTGQYCFSLFAVIAMALVASWFVAVVFAPVIGLSVLPKDMKKHGVGPGRGMRMFRGTLVFSMRRRWLTVVLALAAFGASLFGYGFLQQQFFPASDRPELLVTVNLPKDGSIFATRDDMLKIEKLILEDQDVARSSAYIGGGAIRFYLPLDVQLDNDFIGQFVVVAKDLEARDRVKVRLERAFETGFENLVARVSQLELGPPVGWPVQYRVRAPDVDGARQAAEKVATVLRESGQVSNVNFDWNEKNKVLRLVVKQERARQVGLSSEGLSQALNRVLSGSTVTQVRDSVYLIDLLARAEGKERLSLEGIRNLQVNTPDGSAVPLSELVSFSYELDEGYVWRRDRLPTVTVQAEPRPGLQPATVDERVAEKLAELRTTLPVGTSIEIGGTVEKSVQSNSALIAQVPLMLALMAIVLVFQLQSFMRVALVVSVAPLGLIGVVLAMLTTRTPMGFVAILGIIALGGMIIRNSVILIDQITTDLDKGLSPWDAVIDATLHRFRPILLTAAAAILGMIPIMHDVFWGPMAYAIVGGLAIATVLTLIFLPALYVAVYRIREPSEADEAPDQPARHALLSREPAT